MKKLLMLILIVLLVALSAYIVIEGFEVGSIEILSYVGLQSKNENLDETIQQSSKLAEKDFRQAVTQVTENTKKLEKTKKEYEEMTSINGEGDIQTAGQIERYEVEALWVKLGNYATSEGAILKMDIVRGNTSDTYNLKFTVTGTYISITDFISDIENDSTLGFKIEEFSMIPGIEDTNLKGMFTCKDIAIKDVSSVNSSYSVGGSGTTPNTTPESTTNPTNTTTTNPSNTNSTNNITNNNTNTATSNNANLAR